MPVGLGQGDTGHSYLVSLVLQSQKALQHGEQLCTRAHTASNASAQAAVDVLALEAKIKWVVEAVVEQLKVRLFS
jgi:autophagy-related protein 17